VRESLARLAATPFLLRKESLRGFVYDVGTGELREVTAAAPA
jgi:carbonic anhydrase